MNNRATLLVLNTNLRMTEECINQLFDRLFAFLLKADSYLFFMSVPTMGVDNTKAVTKKILESDMGYVYIQGIQNVNANTTRFKDVVVITDSNSLNSAIHYDLVGLQQTNPARIRYFLVDDVKEPVKQEETNGQVMQ